MSDIYAVIVGEGDEAFSVYYDDEDEARFCSISYMLDGMIARVVKSWQI